MIAELRPRSTATPSCRPAFLPSPTATCTSATPRPSASISDWPTNSAAHTNLRFDDTNPEKEDTEYVDSIMDDVQLARLPVGRAFLRLRLFRPALRVGDQADQGWQGLRRRSDRRRDPPTSRHADRAGQRQPVSQSLGRRKSGPVRAHASRRVPRRLARSARQDRHGLAESQHARSGDVPHPARRASPHRRQVVHLSDVRLRARPVGFDRASHALHLHARIRGPSPALQLVHPAAGHLPLAADRVRPAQPHLHADEQAQAAAAGAGEAGAAAGTIRACRRSAAFAAAATRPRRSAISAARIGVSKTNGIDRTGHARALRPRRPEQARPARHGRAAPAEGRDRQLSRRPGRRDGSGQQSRGRERRHAQSSVLARALHRAGRLPRRAAAKSISASRPDAKCACATAISSPAKASSKTTRAKWSKCTAPTIRRPAAATLPTAAK